MNAIKQFFVAVCKFLVPDNNKPSFEEAFKQEFDPVFEKRLCKAMHKINVCNAFAHPSQSLDKMFHRLWDELVLDGTFSSCFFKAQRASMEFSNFDDFMVEAKLSYYERALASYKFLHPVLGNAQQSEMEEGS